jgi:hypothetical protein
LRTDQEEEKEIWRQSVCPEFAVRTEKIEPDAVAAAAHSAMTIPLRYARAGISIAQAALGGAHDFEAVRHYPRGDVHDERAGTRYFYHAHGTRGRSAGEHGHFHLFVYDATATCATPAFSHLVALSIDARGQPLRWFTTNGWVTGEHWEQDAALIVRLHEFNLATKGRLAPIAQWLSAMVRLLQPQIAALIQRRDQLMYNAFKEVGREKALNDRSVEVISSCSATLAQRIARLAT